MTRLVLLVVVLGAGCASPLVGGECRSGYIPIDGRCEPLIAVDEDGGSDADPGGGDAGAPDGDVTPDAAPWDGAWGDAQNGPDGGAPDATVADGGAPDATIGDAGASDATTTDGGGCACDLGELCCDGACVAPATDALNCGGCGMACGVGELCAGGACAPRCEAPLVLCDGLCIDTSSDPDNCGACGRVCSSGICRDGACGPLSAGHVVVVGHDYARSRAGMDRVAGNAVFLATGAPVRVVVYDGSADPASIRGVEQAVDHVARDLGRSWVRIAGGDADVPYELASADVLLVHAQHGATDDALRALGRDWSVAMQSFVESGRTIVVFDAPSGNAGTYQILQEAGLFSATARTEVSGDDVVVVAPGDAVALGVPIRYRAEDRSVRFDEADATPVVEHAAGPVVLHRVFPPR